MNLSRPLCLLPAAAGRAAAAGRMRAMPATFLDTLRPLAGRALETALNRALELDPDTRDALRALDGRRLVLDMDAPPLALQLRVAGGHLQVGPVLGAEPDLSVRGTLAGLIGQLPFMAGRRDDAAAAGRTGASALRISGDAELARRLQALAKRFDPDWQLPFVRVFGEVAGVQVADAVRAGLLKLREAARDFAETGAEFVTEETGDVVPRAEQAAFHDDVDGLRDDVERLAARVQRLRGAA